METNSTKTARAHRLPFRRIPIFPLATLVAAAGVFVVDVVTPPDSVVSALYIIVLLLAARFCRPRDLWLICAGCAVLSIWAPVLGHRLEGGSVRSTYIGVYNSLVSVLSLVLATWLILRGRQAETALHRAQSDLARVSRATTMGELTASIAHEVKQPIAGVVANADACLRWLNGDAPNVEKARAAATRIARDGTRAAEILERVRSVFVLGAPVRARIDLNALVRETLELIGAEAARYAVTLRTDLAADAPTVMGDPVQLQQVIVNLVVNGVDAVKALAGARQLVVSTERTPEGQALVSVADNGLGLPPDQSDRLFEAFFTTKPHGTGMGLSISRSIIEAHDGALEAWPNRPRGAVFTFTLPAAEAA